MENEVLLHVQQCISQELLKNIETRGSETFNNQNMNKHLQN